MTRRDRTILLLRTRHDWQPGLRSQFSSFGALPGQKATQWRICGSCDGQKTVRTRKGDEPCPKCEGKGRFLVDAYTGRRDDEPETKLFSAAERSEWRRKLEQQIGRLQAQLEKPPTIRTADDLAGVKPYGWEIERDRYMKAGSYRQLDTALEWLSEHNPAARALVGWVYESGADTLGCLDESIVKAADLAVELVAARLPDPIRVPHWCLPQNPAAARKQAERSKAA